MWCSTTASNPEARSRSDRNPPPTPAAPRAATRTCAAQPAPAPARSPRNPTWRNAPLEQRGHGWPRVDRLEATAAGHGMARLEARGTGRSAKKKKSADKPGSVVDNHSSGPHVAVWLKRPTRGRRGPRHGPPIRSCSRWGLPCRSVAGLAVRSYRTVSPLPDPAAPDVPCGTWRRWPSAVCSLLHFPSARAAQALPGTLPCGARTFLGARMNVAVVWPTPGPSVTIGG